MGDAATTLDYTFGTIAHSLAAAIALLATFVLFRMQTLQAEVERRSDALLDLGFDTSGRELHFSRASVDCPVHFPDR